MKQSRATTRSRSAVTLLEVMAAVTLLAAMMAASTVVVRSSLAAWRAHEADLERADAVSAVLRHIVRGVRQSNGVVAVSAPAVTSGSLSVARVDGIVLAWTFSAGAAMYSEGGGTPQPIADGLSGVAFQALRADGVTPTTSPQDARAIRCTVTATMPSGVARTVSSSAWVRSW